LPSLFDLSSVSDDRHRCRSNTTFDGERRHR